MVLINSAPPLLDNDPLKLNASSDDHQHCWTFPEKNPSFSNQKRAEECYY